MKKILLLILPLFASNTCFAEDITVHFNGATAKVEQKTRDSVSVAVSAATVNIESLYKARKLTLRLTGKSDD
jgi:hypothetical protein